MNDSKSRVVANVHIYLENDGNITVVPTQKNNIGLWQESAPVVHLPLRSPSDFIAAIESSYQISLKSHSSLYSADQSIQSVSPKLFSAVWLDDGTVKITSFSPNSKYKSKIVFHPVTTTQTILHNPGWEDIVRDITRRF